MWLREFKKRLEERIHRILWRQWSQLGVLGATGSEGESTLIDPEALLLFTLEGARSEPRLFDEVLDWLLTNGGAIDVQRLRNILKQDPDYPAPLVSAVGSLLADSEPSAKWQRLASVRTRNRRPEPLFLLGNGRMHKLHTREPHFAGAGYLRSPFKPRGLSRPVPASSAALRFRLRGLFGIGIRAECIVYLLAHDDGYAKEIGRAIGYSALGVQQALREMAISETIQARQRGRERRYWLDIARWGAFLGIGKERPRWIDWVIAFRSLASLLRLVRRSDLDKASAYVQASEVRQLARRKQADLEGALPGFTLPKSGPPEIDADSILEAMDRL